MSGSWASSNPHAGSPVQAVEPYSGPLPVTMVPPEPKPGTARRRSPGLSSCEQCRAANGCCSQHVGYFEEVNVLRSAGVRRTASRESRLDASFYPVQR